MVRLSTIIPFLATSSLISASYLPQAPIHRAPDDDDDPLPLIIWHGLGDSFANDGLKSVAALAQETHPGTFTYLIQLAADSSGDSRATWYGNLTEQVDQVCSALASHNILSTAPAVDALGFSQGGPFLRAYVERCNVPPVRSLVTFGSPHSGITDFQACAATDWLCRATQAALRTQTWSSWVQGHLVPAQYFRDPAHLDDYLEYSNFLADINNERLLKNKTYKANLASLEKFVMYLFEDDETVIPKQSSWFADVNGTDVRELRDRRLYKEDWLGLKELDEKGALEFKTAEGGHMRLTNNLLKETFRDYFGPMGRSFKQRSDDLQEEL